MKKIIIAMDKNGNILFDFDGFPGQTCYDELQKLIENLKKLGVEVEIQQTKPKEDAGVQEAQGQRVEEQ